MPGMVPTQNIKPILLGRKNPMIGEYTICTAMPLSGAAIIMIKTIIKYLRAETRRALKKETSAFSAVVPIAAMPGYAAPRLGTVTVQVSVGPPSGSAALFL